MKFATFFSAATLSLLIATQAFSAEVQGDQSRIERSGKEDFAFLSKKSEKNTETTNQNTLPPPPPAPLEMDVNSSWGCLDKGFTIFGEFLLWKTTIDNLKYALTANQPIVGFNGTKISTSTRDPDFEFNPGVRVAVGYDFGRKNWDLFLRWTYMYSDPTDQTGTDNPTFTVAPYPLATQPEVFFSDGLVGNRAKVKWTNRFNLLDVEMGYDYFFSSRFSFRPHFGLRAAWFNMTYVAKYTNVYNTASINSPYDLLSLKSKSSFWGVGPQVGINGKLHIGMGFSLYAVTSGALLYGKFETSSTETDPFLKASFRYHDLYRLRAMAQIGTGLEWGYCFSRNYHLGLSIGWEAQIYWQQLMMRLVNNYEPSGDLTFNGLNAAIRFEF